MALRPPTVDETLNQNERENIFAKYILELERRNLLNNLDLATNGVKDISDEDIFKILILSLQIDSFENEKGKNTKGNDFLKQSKSYLTWVSIVEEFAKIKCLVSANELAKRWLEIIFTFKKKIDSFKRSKQSNDSELSNLDLQIIYNFPSLLNISTQENEKKPQRNNEFDQKNQIIDLTDVNGETNQIENTSQDNDEASITLESNKIIEDPNPAPKYSGNKETIHSVLQEKRLNFENTHEIQNINKNQTNDCNIPEIDIILSSSDDEYMPIDKLSTIKTFRSKNKYQPFHKLSTHNLPRNHWSNWWKGRNDRSDH
ncbi:uncharacterized protein LOC143915585 isoform X2 [Arctopsyche grandis]|uniref:uncharacterized protein LOC143915585 isoform X2 n=1 Tax=Arctopsyche grandis TaxID=121162 RepID=UPI00406D8B1D